ncbi:hypothetical protein BK816_06395 [Boudabousia tangfeifanii]|uniref:DNA-binding transcriptional regulator n=1 Tax=Boudabousia tangfeifanii TaxID=1912795 RepID=A0A1D9MKX7_9ACTO|nr:YerC/YecD family TrpR-related protein [Boudabousia tangfeifanii]AOZ72964.1 hypothetical protein BK816_06395 [Boudabousia tangfeifanii]
MKRRERHATPDISLLSSIMAAIDNPEDMAVFLIDLCTPTELEALADRWRVVPLLNEGMSYRKVREVSGVSVTTIGRVARYMGTGVGGYDLGLDIMEKLGLKDEVVEKALAEAEAAEKAEEKK